MVASSVSAQTPGEKPNILVIFGDDIGIPQISAYTQGLMGYRTPNIDRIAKESRSSRTPTDSRAVRRDAHR
jgi:arylsulfatase